MSTSDTKFTGPPESATQAWDRLAEQVDALISSWETGPELPDLRQFIPAEPAHLRPMMISELIKVDLEFRWHGKRAPKKVEDYVAEFPELAPGGVVPCDLIYEEFHVRKQSGDLPKPEDYYERFPNLVPQLKKLLSMEEPHLTTTMIGSTRMKELKPGTQIDDFDLLTLLGKGAFAQVFLARQKSLQRIVALKVSSDKGTEGQTLAQLDHPHIVRVYDQRVVREQRLRLMYMQNIPGGTLHAVVERVKQTPLGQRTGKLLLDAIDISLDKQGETPPTDSSTRRRLSQASWPEAVCWLGARMAAGLDHAHQHGVLHRDIKPANVLLTSDGTPKLADFNVSFSSKVEGSTPAAYFGGSLAYMSPEQLEAADADHERDADSLDGRSDVYALGIVLWELLSGQRPFSDNVIEGNWSATLKQLIQRRRAGLPNEALKQLPPNLPAGLEAAIVDCLHPDAEQRPMTAGVLSRQLELCLKPRVQRLLRPRANRLQNFAKRYPLVMFIGASLIANLVMCVFNLEYNYYQIISHLDSKSQKLFNLEVVTINAFCYSVGISLGVWFIRPVMLGLRELRLGIKLAPGELPRLRRQSATIGDVVTRITIALWIPSGIAFPLWLRTEVGEASGLHWEHFIHFVFSNLLSGLMAATHTFFLCTFVAIRYFYPQFVQPEGGSQNSDLEKLWRLERRSGYYFVAAVLAPFLAMMLLATIPAVANDAKDNGEVGKWLMGAMALLGFLGSALAFRLYRLIQSDIAALATALDPSHEATVGTETFDATWTSSR
ncbi:MAG TPA: serine/threonine-protein kinase [Pirellulales bacterium]|nr:serine/threonine-protein kinase [Pirellulales bacterium]